MKPNAIATAGVLAEWRASTDGDDVVVKRAFQRLLHTISHLSSHPPNGFLSCVADRGPARAASLLAEPFGIRDWHLVEEATFASLCLDVFAHAIDDIADESEGDRIVLAHVGSLLLARAAQGYARLVGGDQAFWACWERYLREASEAERFLHQHRYSFEQISLEMLGQKSSLINTSVALYATLTGRWNLCEPLEHGLMAVATGIQLIDDLLDWEEDITSGVDTYPLTLAAQRCEGGGSVRDSINSNSVFAEVVDLARTKMEEGQVHFRDVEATRMVSFVSSLIAKLVAVRKQVAHSLAPDAGTGENRRIEQLRWIMGRRLGH